MADDETGRWVDQYPLKLAPGLRPRIKAMAKREGRSMNAVINQVLEREFPEPIPLKKRIASLAKLVLALRRSVDVEQVDSLVDEFKETLEIIARGHTELKDEGTRMAISNFLTRWKHFEESEKFFPLDNEEEWEKSHRSSLDAD